MYSGFFFSEPEIQLRIFCPNILLVDGVGNSYSNDQQKRESVDELSEKLFLADRLL
jgi:hypothetical protein